MDAEVTKVDRFLQHKTEIEKGHSKMKTVELWPTAKGTRQLRAAAEWPPGLAEDIWGNLMEGAV